ncbi:MAG: hypothetical protein AB2807_11155 [Candidatus Sedimenticola endophacoides]
MAHNGFDVEFIPIDITSDRSIRAAIGAGADPERSSVLHTDRRCLREALEANTLGPLMLIQAALQILNGAGLAC